MRTPRDNVDSIRQPKARASWRAAGALCLAAAADVAAQAPLPMLDRPEYARERRIQLGIPGTPRDFDAGPHPGKSLAMEGNTLCPTTFSLFYATDFADRLENSIIPALRAGFVVLADRYIFTQMARDSVRGCHRDWIREVYSMALVPDLTIYLKVSPKFLAERSFLKNGVLDYWESGMDIQRSGDMYQCFIRYQGWLQKEFQGLIEEYKLKVVDGNNSATLVQQQVQSLVQKVLKPKVRGKVIWNEDLAVT